MHSRSHRSVIFSSIVSIILPFRMMRLAVPGRRTGATTNLGAATMMMWVVCMTSVLAMGLVATPETACAKTTSDAQRYTSAAERYYPLVAKYAKEYGVDPALALSIIHTESGFNPQARGASGGVGLFQLIPKYAGKRARQYILGRNDVPTPTVQELLDPETNIRYGMCFLKVLFAFFKEEDCPCKQLMFVLGGNNCGPNRMRLAVQRENLLERPTLEVMQRLMMTDATRPVPEITQRYIRKVLERRLTIWAPFVMAQGGSVSGLECSSYFRQVLAAAPSQPASAHQR